MNATVSKGMSIMLAVIMAAAVIPFFMDSSDANPGDTEADPLIWWNNTIILLPEVVAGEITDPENEVLEPPESLVIDWGDGNSQVETVDGYVNKGDVEIVHTYADTGSYHITCTPQKSGYTYETYELWMDIQGAPTVYFYDGEEEITHIVAENGYGVGAYEDNYFSKISAPEDPSKEGMTFAGWFLNGEEFDFDTPIKNPTVLQAHWTDAPVSTDITVYIDGYAITFQQGTVLSSITDPAYEGYTFAGWCSDEERTVILDGSTVLTDGMHLYTKWTQNTAPVEQITVIVDGQNVTVDEGKTVADLPVPTQEGKTFQGWYADEACTVALENTTVLTDGMHAYAKLADVANTEEDAKEFWEGLPVVAISICAIGAIIALAGLRYHPVILVIGAVVIVVGVLDCFGIVNLF